MTELKTEYKRATPLLGTYFEIRVESRAEAGFVQSEISDAFREAARLEKIFNYHDSCSELSLLNRVRIARAVSREMEAVLRMAREMGTRSRGAFLTIRPENGKIDLSGIAKGYIVDRVVESLSSALPDACGLVSAGGDMRFFRNHSPETTIRLSAGIFRRIRMKRLAVAVSSPVQAQDFSSETSTTYYRSPNAQASTADTIAVFSDSCAIADAMTKVAMFARPEVLTQCAEHFASQVVFFDHRGDVQSTVVNA